jgi:hypothetical protein
MLTKNLYRIEGIARSTVLHQDAVNVYFLNLLSMVSECLAMMSRERKPTQTEKDELVARAEALKKDLEKYVAQCKQDFDEQLAKRMAKLFDTKGPRAMCGAGDW